MSWSKQDTEAFQQIVTKAKNCGVLESLCEGQQVIHAGSPSSQFSMVSSVQVSMTDAAKRRASVEIEQLQQSSIPGGSNSMCTGYANRKGSAEVNQPVYHDETAVTEKIKLPPGVPDFETWGKTRIDFGKYMGHNMSYVQLARSLSPECTKYKTWCIQRNQSAEGLLKDLSDFLVEYQKIESQKYGLSGSGMPFIPGTDRLRILLD